MRSESSFVIAIALLSMLVAYCLWVIHQQMKATRILISDQRASLNSMMNLLAAKDISAYAALESVAVPAYEAEGHMPMDDQSIAKRMQDSYESMGLDPNMAIDHDSDPLADFGGTHSLI